jgi:LacI family transcriptional regulator, repressor for deo operon, udp, cdd, tsx, nupC, and nupG
MAVQKIRNMAEFAQLSGISRPTVSKYFNDPASVRKSIRSKIERALLKYDYRPNLFAVNLNKKKPKIIGVIVPDTSDMFYVEMVRNIEIRCAVDGYFALVLSSRGDPLHESRSIDTLLSLKIAGAIVAPLGAHSDAQRMESLRAHIPIVYLDSSLHDGSPFVGTDNLQSIGLITDYLCRTGSPPTFFDMPPVNHNAAERKAAYVATMERLGFQPEVIGVTPRPDWRFEEIAYCEALRVIDGSGFPTTTLVCANDRIAIGVMAAAFQRGLKVGREADCRLRVAGHDDQPYSRFGCPPLTTVAQDFSRLGSLGVEMLLRQVEGGAGGTPDASQQVRLEARLMMRASA